MIKEAVAVAAVTTPTPIKKAFGALGESHPVVSARVDSGASPYVGLGVWGDCGDDEGINERFALSGSSDEVVLAVDAALLAGVAFSVSAFTGCPSNSKGSSEHTNTRKRH